MSDIIDKLKHVWNVFTNRDPPGSITTNLGMSSTRRPDISRSRYRNDHSIVSTIKNRISVDCATIPIQHVRLDEEGRFKEVVDSSLNNCLNLEANIDQSATAFRQDIVGTLLDEGHAVIVPVDTSVDPKKTDSYSIETMRVGKVTQWYPRNVRVDLYNDRTGLHQEVVLPKKNVAIIQNPFYRVMNETNSIMQRLQRKLNILDVIDEQSGAGKLDLIIQLPYTIKTEARRQQAENRRKDIEMQLAGSKYGIAYTDGTEHITQLNRPVENNLMKQIEYLTSMLYSQFGISSKVLDGSANDQEMMNYEKRIIEPILTVICEGIVRTFLTKTARTQRQTVTFFNDVFKLVPVKEIASMADSLSRNEILTSNEFRSILGRKPIDSPEADELRNKNLYQEESDGDMNSGEEENYADIPVSSLAGIRENNETGE